MGGAGQLPEAPHLIEERQLGLLGGEGGGQGKLPIGGGHHGCGLITPDPFAVDAHAGLAIGLGLKLQLAGAAGMQHGNAVQELTAGEAGVVETIAIPGEAGPRGDDYRLAFSR